MFANCNAIPGRQSLISIVPGPVAFKLPFGLQKNLAIFCDPYGFHLQHKPTTTMVVFLEVVSKLQNNFWTLEHWYEA